MQTENGYIALGMKAAASMLDVTRDEIRLTCGEMTAKEMKTVLAVLKWRHNAIIRKAEEYGERNRLRMECSCGKGSTRSPHQFS